MHATALMVRSINRKIASLIIFALILRRREGRNWPGSNAFERKTEPEPAFGFEVQHWSELNAGFEFGVQSEVA